MPANNVVYWDACVMLSYISGIPERLSILDAVLDKAEKGEITILTSSVSIVEVAYAQKEGERSILSAETEKKINDLWDPKSPIKLVEFHRLICHSAGALSQFRGQIGT